MSFFKTGVNSDIIDKTLYRQKKVKIKKWGGNLVSAVIKLFMMSLCQNSAVIDINNFITMK
jgi:hypothetical protein